MNEVAKAWTDQHEAIEKTATEVTALVRKRLKVARAERKLPPAGTAAAEGLKQLTEQFDPEHGGFGFNPTNPRRPKFPQPVDLQFLLERHRALVQTAESTDPLKMVLLTVDRMARGGIRDQLAGGYHRYSTDRYWLVPHFEKMLYDNAQLASVHLLAFELTHDMRWRDEAQATLAFIERRMTAPEGGFYSALDAETKGEEGAYYVWTRDQVQANLAGDLRVDLFSKVYGLDAEPNFEGGRYVLHESRTRAEQSKALKITEEELESRLIPLRAKLLAARDKRPAPLCDDKILTGWNGLMIAAYADGYRLLKVDKYRQIAEKAATFLFEKLRLPDGRLLRTFRLDRAKLPAYLEDYAFFTFGLLKLHAATGDARWLKEARSLADRMIADFEDRDEGGFFFTADGHESLLARAKDPFDNALPAGNSMAILDLMELYRVTGDVSYRDHAGRALGALSSVISKAPAAVPMVLIGLEKYMRSGSGLISKQPIGADPLDDVSQQIVTASARVAEGRVATFTPGRELDAIVTVTIQDGWHVYANPTGVAEMKPTTLGLDSKVQPTVSLVKVFYPAGDAKVLSSLGNEKIALYEGKVEFKARVKISEQARAGTVAVPLNLFYQACNDRVCQVPAQLEILLKITVGQ